MDVRQQIPGHGRSLAAGAGTVLFVVAIGIALTSRFPLPAQAGSTSCASAQQQGRLQADPTYVRITFSNQCGQPEQLAVDIAADNASQEQGLMNVSQLPADQGELFDLANVADGYEIRESFWMEDTLIPLSIAFIGKDGTIHEIQDMAANTTDLHTPSQNYLYAVEANEGWFASHQIVAGSKVDLSSALALVAGGTGH